MPQKCAVIFKSLLWAAFVRVSEVFVEKEHVLDHLRVYV